MRRIFPLIYWLIAVFILVSLVWDQLALKAVTPQGATYAYVSGHTGDFYGYTYMIRRGREGHLLYHNVYTPTEQPDALSHPFFHLLGLVSRPFPVSPGIVFFLARIGAFALLFWAVFFFLDRVFKREETKLLAGVFVLTATSLWHWASVGITIFPTMPTTYSDYFDMFGRYTRVPPHHVVAFACFILLLYIFGKPVIDRKNGIIAVLLTIAIGLLQPYLVFLLGLIIGIHCGISWLVQRKAPRNIVWFGGVIVTSLVMLAANAYALHLLAEPFASIAENATGARYVNPLTYLIALGPLTLLSIAAFGNVREMGKTTVRLLLLWAIVPAVLFFLPEVANITSTYRILQTYQQLPIAILAALGIEWIAGKRAWYPALVVVLAVLPIVCGVYPFVSEIHEAVVTAHPEHFNEYIPSGLMQTFSYLNSSTPAESMVLAGENLSAMVPAFTHNRVLIGEDSASTNYTEKVSATISFFQGTMTPTDALTFLKKYHIRYILFGMDSPLWENSPYLNIPSLALIKQFIPLEIVEVR